MTSPSEVTVSGSHICSLSRSAEGQREFLLSFLEEGITNGESCLCVVPDQDADEWSKAFQIRGITSSSGGRLQILKGSDWRLQRDANSIIQARRVWRMMERALWNYRAVRFAVDMNWTLDADVPVDRLSHWEAALNPLLGGGVPTQMICGYRLDALPDAFIVAGLRTHPSVVLDDKQVSNPYYEAPSILEDEPHRNLPGPDVPPLNEMLARIAEQPKP